MSCPHPTPAEGTSLGALCPHTGFRSRRFCNRSNPEHNSELTLCRGDMAADNPLESPAAPLSSAFPSPYLLFPFQGRAPWSSNSALFQTGSTAIAARLSPEQERRAPAARAPRWAVTGSPSYTSVPGPRGKGSAAEGLSHRLRANPGVTHRGVACVSLSRLGALDVSFAAGTSLRTSSHLSEHASVSRCPFDTARDRGQPGELCRPRARHPPVSAPHWGTCPQERRESRERAIPPSSQLGRKFSFQPHFSSPPSSLTPPRFRQTTFAAILCLGAAQLPQEPSHAAREISYVQS